MDHNPYEPPRAAPNDREDVKDLADLLLAEDAVLLTDEQAAALRESLLTHEAWLQTIGTLMLLSACLMISESLFSFFVAGRGIIAVDGFNEQSADQVKLVYGVFLTAYSVLSVHGGLSLGRLDPNSTALYTVIGCLWTVCCSPCSPLGVWTLYLLRSKAGKTVLSTAYQEIRSRTPQLYAQRSLMNQLTLVAAALMTLAFFAKKL